MAASSYSVTLHHLAPGATAAGLNHPDVQLATVTPAQLRDLLYALAEVATNLTIYEPSTPEIRIKTDRDVFVVRTRYRQLCFVGWETTLRGEEHSVPYILTTVTEGTAELTRAAPTRVERAPSATPLTPDARTTAASGSRRLKITLMAVLILGFNGFTAWMLFRPTPSLMPSHELMAESDSHILLVKAAGEYQTGNQPGDRRLSIAADGTLRFTKYSSTLALTEPRNRPSRGATVAGKTVLITTDSNPIVVEIRNADTVAVTNTVYRRLAP